MKRIIENLLMLLVILLVAAFVGMTLTGCSTQESIRSCFSRKREQFWLSEQYSRHEYYRQSYAEVHEGRRKPAGRVS